MTANTRLSALALALAALATATFLAGSSAPAETVPAFKRSLPTTNLLGTGTAAPAPAGGLITRLPPGELNQLLTSHLPPRGIGPICPLTGTGCGPIPRPPATGGGHGPWVPPWDRGWGHDHDHDHDYGYGYGYDHDRWFHHYGWRFMPPIVVEGAGGVVAAAPVMQGVPARAPVAAPAMAVPQSAPTPQAAAEPCNCLTKQTLPDGSVLFQDICTKESAIAPPQAVSAR